MSFSPEWLALREPADHAARSRALLAKVGAAFTGRTTLHIVDLGCGGELPPAGGEVTGIARLEVRGGADADEPGPAARPDERIGGIGVLEQVAQRGDFAGDDA